jgi:cytochrome c-type biogenesis protein CcmH/NrfF
MPHITQAGATWVLAVVVIVLTVAFILAEAIRRSVNNQADNLEAHRSHSAALSGVG